MEDHTLIEARKNKLAKELEDMTRRISEEQAREASLRNNITSIDEDFQTLNQKYASLIKNRNQAKREYEKLLNSTSWYISTPYRKTMDILRNKRQGTNRHGNKKRVNYKLTSKEKRVKSGINSAKKKLNNLGFTEAAYEYLYKHYASTKSTNYLKKLAAWELAIWHANQYSEEDARKCLPFLYDAIKDEKDKTMIRQATVIEVEAFHQLGKTKVAKKILSRMIKKEAHADLYLAYANLEDNVSKKLYWMNKAMSAYALTKVELKKEKVSSYYDGLMITKPKKTKTESVKISVIIPAYNAENEIGTAIESLLNQTWSNIEILIVDDCSTDNTVQVVQLFADRDDRVKLIKSEKNSGAYVARNIGLDHASGDFITVNDSDDWSHSSKLEIQASHLLDNPTVVGNTSQQARLTNNLVFERRGNPGYYLFKNMSSLMFRADIVRETLGYWDSVRFVADGEFLRRAKKVFGSDAIVDLETGPLSFQRQINTSLTASKEFGYKGFLMGARKEYFESYLYYHNTSTQMKFEFPQKERPFPIPEPMKPTREVSSAERREFDVILISDFRLAGGSNMSNVEEIIAQKKMGLKVGLVQMYRYDLDPNRQVNYKVRDQIDGEQVQMVVYGEKVKCNYLTLRYPPVLQKRQLYVPDIEAEHINVIVNQPPMSDYGPNGVLRYDIREANKHLFQYFGKQGIWHPIGPLVRNVLHENHSEELKSISLSEEDWSNIIDVDKWKRKRKPTGRTKPKIGRHSRDHEVKWPATREELLAIYPESRDCDVSILGGGSTPKKIIGYIPDNWDIKEFGEVHPKEFLEDLDVFIYYTHPDWVEAFGRVIIEAMAVGIPVILPHSYKELFKESAIYAYPQEVAGKVKELFEDEAYYDEHVKMAHKYVDENFGYNKHASRIGVKVDKTADNVVVKKKLTTN